MAENRKFSNNQVYQIYSPQQGRSRATSQPPTQPRIFHGSQNVQEIINQNPQTIEQQIHLQQQRNRTPQKPIIPAQYPLYRQIDLTSQPQVQNFSPSTQVVHNSRLTYQQQPNPVVEKQVIPQATIQQNQQYYQIISYAPVRYIPCQLVQDYVSEGLLKIYAIHAKNIKVGYGKMCDPFLKFIYENQDGSILSSQTSIVKQNNHPVWNELRLMTITYLKTGQVPKLLVQLWCQDISGDQKIGKLRIDITNCISNPCTWEGALDANIYSDKNEIQGQVSLEVYYVPKGVWDPNVYPMTASPSRHISTPSKYMIDQKYQPGQQPSIPGMPYGPRIQNPDQYDPNKIPRPSNRTLIDQQEEDGFGGGQGEDRRPVSDSSKPQFQQTQSQSTGIQSKFGIKEGTLKVLVVRAKNIKGDDGEFSDPYCKLMFEKVGQNQFTPRGKEEDYNDQKCVIAKTGVQKKTVNPVWNEICSMDIAIPTNTVAPKLLCQLWDKDVGSDDILGNCQINIIPSVDQPGKWAVDDWFDIIDTQNRKQGKIHLQCYFIPKGYEDMQMAGKLFVNIIQAARLANSDLTGKSDPYVEFSIDRTIKQKIKSKTIDSNLDPIWNEQKEFDIDLKASELRGLNLKAAVYDEDVDSNDFLGSTTVNLDEYLYNPAHWFNFVTALHNKSGQSGRNGLIYFQLQWRPDGLEIDTTPPEMLDINKVAEDEYSQIIQKGVLWVFAQSAKGLKADEGKFSDPYAKFTFENFDGKKKECKTKYISKTVNPEWNQDLSIDIEYYRDSQNVPLQVSLWDHDTLKDDSLGAVEIDIFQSISNPGKWLKGQFEVKEAETDNKQGIINVQTYFIPKDYEEPKFKGKLFVNVLQAGYLIKADTFGKSDPFTQLQLNKHVKQSLQTKVIDDNQNPIWNFEDNFDIEIKQHEIKGLTLLSNVYDKDTLGKSLLGTKEIDIEYLFVNPGEWFNQIVILQNEKQQLGKNGMLYLMIQWRPDSQRVDTVRPELKNLEAFYQTEYKSYISEGTLKIYATQAVNVKADDGKTSDPYAKFIFENVDGKKVTTKTETIEKTINPKWRDLRELPIKFYKAGQVDNLLVEVWDHDALSDDQLGQVKIDITEAILKPCNWASGAFDIVNEKDESIKQGQIELGFYFIPANKVEPNIKGEMFINVVQASHLIKADLFGKSDPFVEINVNRSIKQKIKTKVVDNNQNPIWNHQEIIEVNLKQSEIKGLWLTSTVLDDDTMGSSFLGKTEIELDELFSKPGGWFNNIIILSNKKDQQGKNGMVYLMIQWRPQGLNVDKRLPVQKNIDQFYESNYKQYIQEGTLKIYAEKATNVKPDDGKTSDPYAKFTFENVDGKKVNVKTKHINKNLNPKWEELLSTDIKFYKMGEVTPLQVEVFDHDKLSDDTLGLSQIDISAALNQPFTWQAGNYEIKDTQTQQQAFGNIDVQVYFIPKDTQEPAVIGQLFVNCVQASHLISVDTFGSSDPFTELTINRAVKQKITTKTIKNNCNPEWNHQDQFTVSTKLSEIKGLTLNFNVFDKDVVTNDFLGIAKLPLEYLFENPGNWVNQVQILSDKNELMGKNGMISYQVQWRPQGLNVNPQLPSPQDITAFYENEYKKYIQIGVLKVFVSQARNVKIADKKTSDPYCKFSFTNVDGKDTVAKTSVKKKTTNPQWNEQIELKVKFYKSGSQVPLICQVYDSDFGKDDSLGMVLVDVNQSIAQPCNWAKGVFAIKDEKTSVQQGEIEVETYFVPDGTIEPVHKGELFVNVVQASGLINKDSSMFGGKSDPYTEISLNSGQNKPVKTKTIDNNLAPTWDHTESMKIEMTESQIKGLKIKFRVMNKNVMSDDELGTKEIDLSEYLQNPGQWFNQISILENKESQLGRNGVVYVQFQYRPEGQEQMFQNQQLPQKLDIDQFFETEYKQYISEGVIKIYAVSGQDLKADEGKTSDPYAKFTFSNVDGKKQSAQTKHIEKTLNPQWSTLHEIPVKFYKSGSTTPLRVEVFDHDAMSDDTLGISDIDINACINYPLQWTPTTQYQIADEKDPNKKQGNISLSFYFVPKDVMEPVVKGKIYGHIIQAGYLIKTDMIGSSDPYVELSVNRSIKNVIKSKEIKNNVNPVWDHEGNFEVNIKYTECRGLVLKCVVKDKDTIKDEFMGSVETKLDQLFEQPGNWYNQIYIIKDSKGKQGKNGAIYFMLQWRPDGVQCNPTPPAVKDFNQYMDNEYKQFIQEGVLSIFVPEGKDIKPDDGKTSDPYAKFQFLNANGKKQEAKTRTIDKSLNPLWNDVLHLNVSFYKTEDAVPLQVSCWDHDKLSDDNLGIATVDIRKVLENPNTWGQNFSVPLATEAKPDEKQGEIIMNMYFQPKGQPDYLAKGKLFVNVIQSAFLKKVDTFGTSDPFVEIEMNRGIKQKLKTKPIDNNCSPEWNHQEELALSFNMANLKGLELKSTVFDKDTMSKTFLGDTVINIENLIENPGSWYNKVQILKDKEEKQGKNGIIYFMLQWRPEGANINTTLPVAQDVLGFIENDYKQYIQEGTLTIFASEARNVKADEGKTSDPYAKFTFDNINGKQAVSETESIKKTLNPKWKSLHTMDISFYKQGAMPQLQIGVWDKDALSDDTLGSCEANLYDACLNYNAWTQTTTCQIKDEKTNKEQGQIDLQFFFVPKGLPEPEVKGKLFCHVVKAAMLVKADIGGTSDPFVELKCNRIEKKVIKTNVVKKNLNPTWDQKEELDFNLKLSQTRGVQLNASVFDYDLTSNDFLGGVDLELESLFARPGSWFNEIVVLKNKDGNSGKNGVIYMMIQWRPEGQEMQFSQKAPQQQNMDQFLQTNYNTYISEGSIKVFIPAARKIKPEGQKAHPFAKMIFGNASGKDSVAESKPVENTLNPEWPNDVYSLPVSFYSTGAPSLQIQLFDKGTIGSDQISQCEVDISSSIKNPLQWTTSNEIKLQDPKNPDQTQGDIDIQIYYVPKDKKEPIVKGKLFIDVVSAGSLKKVDSGGKSDPFVSLKFNKLIAKETKTRVIKKNLDPEWGQTFQLDVMIKDSQRCGFYLDATVYDDDMVGKDFLGKTRYDLGPLLNEPGTWFNQIIILEDQNGEKGKSGVLYCMLQWRPEDVQINLQEPEHLSLQQFYQTEYTQHVDEGILKIFIGKVTGIKGKQTTDPYVKVEFEAEDNKKIDAKTATINDSLNPNFHQTVSLDIAFNKAGIIPDLNVQVYDDKMSDKHLSSVKVPISDLLKGKDIIQDKPLQWTPVKTYQLNSEQDNSEAGDVGIALYFIPKDEKEQQVNGKIFLNVIQGVNLINVDTLSKSDPFVEMNLNKPIKKVIKTKYKDNDLNPIWNHKDSFSISGLDFSQVKDLILTATVYDDDALGKKFMGSVELHLEEFFLSQGLWHNDSLVLKNEKGKPGKNGDLYFQLQWRPEGVQVDTKVPQYIDVMTQNKPVTSSGRKSSDRGSQRASVSEFDLDEGTLKLYIVKGKDIKRNDKIGAVQIRGAFQNALRKEKLEFKTGYGPKTVDPEWNEPFELQINYKSTEIMPPLVLQLYHKATFADDFIGSINVDLDDCLKEPCQWAINQFFDAANQNKQCGQVHVQGYFVPKGEQDPNIKPQIVSRNSSAVNLGIDTTIDGTLVIKVVHAKNLRIADKMSKSSDPYCVLEFPTGNKGQTDHVSKNLNPVWNKEFREQLKIPASNRKSIRITVKDHDTMGKDDELGFVNIDWKQCLIEPQSWAVNKLYKLTGSFEQWKNNTTLGELYIAIKFVQTGAIDNNEQPVAIENLAQQEDVKDTRYSEEKQEQHNQEFKQGILQVNIIQGGGLLKKDIGGSSDPYVEVKFNKHLDKFKTKTIKKNLHPEWNHEESIELTLPQSELDKIVMIASVFDQDFGKDEFMGEFTKPLKEYVNPDEKLGQWFNEIVELKDENGNTGNNGLIYIQIQWQPENEFIDKTLPQKLDIGHFYKGVKPVGNLRVKIIRAKDILCAENNKFSDAYLKLEFNKKEQKTQVKKDASPEWNQYFTFKVDCKVRSQFPSLQCSLWDHNTIQKDQFLGDFEINVENTLDKPNQYAIISAFNFSNLQNRKVANNLEPKGNVQLAVAFVEEGNDPEQLIFE